MMNYEHELRDPIHNFIRFSSDERSVIDSRPIQRLRHIHQLALTSLVYPGGIHSRFEHSLGVMELASSVYDVVCNQSNLDESVRGIIPSDFKYDYWRQVLRMAALCHDSGHLPFSHAAEKDLLPEDWDHERITLEIVRSPEMKQLWSELKVQSKDVAKITVGPKYFDADDFTSWETILSEIISGDAFGVDRMDYLLRDSYHAGVAYGMFDHFRLIDTLRILPRGVGEQESEEPVLGIEEGGLHTAEALILARFFMFSQVYLHPVRRILDIHLKDFLKDHLDGGHFSTDIEDHLQMTDNEITAAFLQAARDPRSPGHNHALRIVMREHFRKIYQRNPEDIKINPEAAEMIFEAACNEFGEDSVRLDSYKPRSEPLDFPVITGDGRRISSLAISKTMQTVPVTAVDFVFISQEHRDQATKWLNDNREAIITPTREEKS